MHSNICAGTSRYCKVEALHIIGSKRTERPRLDNGELTDQKRGCISCDLAWGLSITSGATMAAIGQKRPEHHSSILAPE